MVDCNLPGSATRLILMYYFLIRTSSRIWKHHLGDYPFQWTPLIYQCHINAAILISVDHSQV